MTTADRSSSADKPTMAADGGDADAAVLEERSNAHLLTGEPRDPYTGTPYEERSSSSLSSSSTRSGPAHDTGTGVATPREGGEEESDDEEEGEAAQVSNVETLGSGKEHIRVTCRLRPMTTMEMAKGTGVCTTVDRKAQSVTLNLENAKDEGDDISAQKSYAFTFDKVYMPEVGQAEIFEDIASPVLDGVMNGFNGAILAYGQTGAGKTHTIMGSGPGAGENRGLIPRVMESVFARAENTKDDKYTVRLSYVECYKEKLNDLLDPTVKIKLFQGDKQTLWVVNATQREVKTMQDVTNVINTGLRRRKVGATALNNESSRSHAILIVTVIKKGVSDYLVKASQLYIVDLAGSERVKKSESTGERLLEGRYINTSLLALGNVISALADKKKHVPYRSSLLTRLLQNSFGGNARTVVIINCSPSNYNARETLNSLRFGDRTRQITNKPVQNRIFTLDEYRALYEKTKEELDRTRAYVHTLESELEFYQGIEAKLLNGETTDISRDRSWKVMRSSITCPLTREIMTDPVIAADGFTYERKAISSYLIKNAFVSPTTNEKLPSTILIPNRNTHALIRTYTAESKDPTLQVPRAISEGSTLSAVASPATPRSGAQTARERGRSGAPPQSPGDKALATGGARGKQVTDEILQSLKQHTGLLIGRYSYLEYLPEDLLEVVLSMCSGRALMTLAVTNKYFLKTLTANDALWRRCLDAEYPGWREGAIASASPWSAYVLLWQQAHLVKSRGKPNKNLEYVNSGTLVLTGE